MKAWTKEQAEGKAEELKETWSDFGEWADQWLQHQTGDPNLQIWDFTEKEMKVLLQWSIKRGQTTPVVAWALDAAMEGRTDVNFAVILGTKALQTGFTLSQGRRRS